MKVNTIGCVSYNYNQRIRLDEILRAAEAERKAVLDSLAESDEEDDSVLDSEIERTAENVRLAWLDCFAAQFHRCKNDWFASVIAQYERGKSHQISERQFLCFSKYASDEDAESWRTFERYCRCSDALVTLKWKNGNRSIKVETIRI